MTTGGYEVPEHTELPSTPGEMRDLVLQDLLGIVNRFPPTRIGVTLLVNGAVISGDLVGAELFFAEYGDLWRQFLHAAPAVAEKIAGDWSAVGARYTEAVAADPSLPFHFVHLVNAHFLVGGNLFPSNRGLAWRGRVSHVSGFSIGLLGSPGTIPA